MFECRYSAWLQIYCLDTFVREAAKLPTQQYLSVIIGKYLSISSFPDLARHQTAVVRMKNPATSKKKTHKARHSLSSIDKEALTAICAICGPALYLYLSTLTFMAPKPAKTGTGPARQSRVSIGINWRRHARACAAGHPARQPC